MTATGLLSATPGQVFPGNPRRLTLARALAFSGGPFDSPDWPEKNLHTDLKEANDAGLAAVVASGTQFEGYLATHLIALCGASWYSHGEWDVKIVRSVKVGDVVTPMAKLNSRKATDKGTKVDLEVWCENHAAEKVLVGTASCLVDRKI